MSSDVSASIADELPDLAGDVPTIVRHLSFLDVGQFTTAQEVEAFTHLPIGTCEAVTAEMERLGLIRGTMSTFCNVCDGLVEAEMSCDLCEEDAQLIEKSGFVIEKEIESPTPWYVAREDLADIPELPRRFFTGVPRFIHALQKHPPMFLQSVLRGTSPEESDFRDEVLRAASFVCGADAEVECRKGRTDLILRSERFLNDTVVGEFKIWGRNDYLKVISQILQYFTEFERYGFVFMVNPNRKLQIGERYKADCISKNPQLVVDSVVDGPVLGGNSRLEHYRSQHQLRPGAPIHIFHFILNLFIA